MKVHFGFTQPQYSSASDKLKKQELCFGQTDLGFPLRDKRFEAFYYNGIKYTDWAQIPTQPNASANPFVYNTVIEMPTGALNKLEVNKENGQWFHDAKHGQKRVNLVKTPADYGFIPQTLGADNDMVDTFVLRSNVATNIQDTPEKLHPRAGEVAPFEVIGALLVEDDGELDTKVVLKEMGDTTIPEDISLISPTSQTWATKFEAMKEFLKSYKPGAMEKMQFPVRHWLSRTEAKKLIDNAHQEWLKFVDKKPRPKQKVGV